MDKHKKLKTFLFASILVLYALLLAYKINLPAADDLPRHIMNGKMILHGHFDVLYKNFFSYTMPDQPFVNHHWLFGVIAYLVQAISGWGGLVIFKILVMVAAFALLFRAAVKKSNFWLAAFFSLPAMIILLNRGGLRPEIFSYLFIALYLRLFFQFEENPNSKKIFWLIPLQFLWVNIHIFFIAGLAMTGGFLLEKVILEWKNLRHSMIVRKLSMLLVALFAVCLLNPNGLRGALYPLHIFQNYGMSVSENNSVMYFLRHFALIDNTTIVVFIASMAALAFGLCFAVRRRPVPVFLILGSVATAAVGMAISRMFSTFALFFLPTICLSLKGPYDRMERRMQPSPALSKRLRKIFASILFGLILLVGFLGIGRRTFTEGYFGLGITPHALDAADFIKENGIRGPIFNDYDIGSYLIYNLYPGDKVFVDNRPEAYSEDFFKQIYLPIFSDENAWQASLDTFAFNSIILYRYDLGPGVDDFMYRRMADPAWSLVYADDFAVIFVRNAPENESVIKAYKITPDNIEARMDYLLHSGKYEDMVAAADNFNLLGRTDLGMQTFFNVVHKWPRKGKIWMVMGEWELGNNNPKSPLLAIAYLEQAISLGYKTAESYYQLAKAYAAIDYKDEATLLIRKALRVNPQYGNATDLYNSLFPGNNAAAQ